ncbi:MAG: YbaK/EbsC family protein [Aestuariivirga sp.]|jgi:prolyl-tRNA editing enzyme YbaK/EbsC (Cys-tRNA(Pro) deacylase)|nr:MAG: YbaK/EbsC family protein [Hyphomicrobiales bacterium]
MESANPEPEPRAVAKVRGAAMAAGLEVRIAIMPESTRTAEDAAAACGCDVGQIVKSLVFRGKDSRRPILLLVSGRNRVDTVKVAAVIGEALDRPDADFVRAVTGYAIGGIPPIGHDTPMATYLDTDLLGYPEVFAAAGTPNAIMTVNPAALSKVAAAIETKVA